MRTDGVDEWDDSPTMSTKHVSDPCRHQRFRHVFRHGQATCFLVCHVHSSQQGTARGSSTAAPCRVCGVNFGHSSCRNPRVGTKAPTTELSLFSTRNRTGFEPGLIGRRPSFEKERNRGWSSAGEGALGIKNRGKDFLHLQRVPEGAEESVGWTVCAKNLTVRHVETCARDSDIEARRNANRHMHRKG